MTKQEINAGVAVIKAVAESIRELKEVPSGHIYAHLMGKLSLDQYERIISILSGAGLIKVMPSHLLVWTGPA